MGLVGFEAFLTEPPGVPFLYVSPIETGVNGTVPTIEHSFGHRRFCDPRLSSRAARALRAALASWASLPRG